MRSLNDILADSRVEIFTEKNPSKRVNRPEICRLRHLAFCVDSVEQTVNELAEAGIECEPIRVDDFTDKNLKEQMDTAVVLYGENCSLQSIADSLDLNPIKIRKLLITTGVYESEVAEKVQDTFEEYREAKVNELLH